MPKRKKEDESSNSRLIELERSMRLSGKDDSESMSQSDFVFDFSKDTVRIFALDDVSSRNISSRERERGERFSF